MRNQKRLLLGGSALLLAALIVLCFQPFHLSAGSEVCNGVCSITETTVSDFVQGALYYTGIRNIGDGEVQLIPVGLTSPWYLDPYTLPATRVGLAATIYRAPDGRETIFAIGGFDNLGAPQAEIYTATTTITGAITAPGWQTVTHSPLDIPLGSTQAVISTTASGGYLYVIGGYTTDLIVTSTILYKALNLNGALPSGAWSPAELPPSPAPGDPLYWHQAFVRNGYLYIVAGADTSGNPGNAIYRAPIQANGALGDWIADTPSPITRGAFASAIWHSENNGDWLYLIGGIKNKFDPAGQAQVDYANFGSGGALGSFDQLASALPASRYGHTAVQSGGVLFTIGGDQGGSGGTAITNTVLSGLIDSTPGKVGQLAYPWITTNPLGEGRKYHASVISSIGEIYVIGGFGPSGGGGVEPKNTVYHGGTAGIGSTFAPAGKYESRVINRANNRAIIDLKVNATLTRTTGMTLTMQYRAANDLAALLGKGWTTLGNMDTGTPTSGLTQTFQITTTDRTFSLLQYRALYTTENNAYSPILNAFQVNYYPPPTPTNIDFTVVDIGTPNANGTAPISQTIVVRVSNIGTQNFNNPASPLARPLALSSAPARPKSGSALPFVVPRASPSAISYYVWVDVYIDPSPAPTAAYPAGNCMDWTGTQIPGVQYIQLYGLGAGQSVDLTFQCYVTTTGTHNYYAQVDTCWDANGLDCSHTYGLVMEKNNNEANNIKGPVPSGHALPASGRLFLPLILR
ncbi:MAG: hypothetical protein FJ009_00310 [Chloroflexi bacterium]|nr:hypothetical protein [Chloroflexota bacterium]